MEHDFSYEKKIIAKEFQGIIGQKEVIQQIKSAILMKRNLIIVGSPGIGKTTLVKNLVNILPEKIIKKEDGNEEHKKPPFIRVQGSPDLTAEDLIGDIDPVKAMKHGPLSLEAFTPGKIFKADKGILFFDEVNRCSEKLQNALLQALEEKKVTIGSYDVDLEADFIFIGTMNPEEASTEPLSDVFLDRFDLVYMEPPETKEQESQIVKKYGKKLVEYPDELLNMSLEFIRALRQSKDLEKKPSVRASLGIYERAQSNAYLKQKERVSLEDVQRAMISVLSHRIRLKPSLKYLKSTSDYVNETFTEFCESTESETGGSP
ncbi:AAA family ATPase [Candidatus Woesearchaeota archaeon]|nr:AAA family ATPase [Candidatus Woesearchaeota archaeon]